MPDAEVAAANDNGKHESRGLSIAIKRSNGGLMCKDNRPRKILSAMLKKGGNAGD